MPLMEPRTIPNLITVGRIVVTPAVFFLILAEGFWPRLVAFLLFLAAALSDVWDGHLARKHGWISDFGKLMDPIADKLLMVASFVPFFLVSHRPGEANDLPWWGAMPVWVLVVIFGRELLITVIRQIAAARGRVIPAGTAGKFKAAFQSVFAGAAILWYALQSAAVAGGWSGVWWERWQEWLHGPVVALSLGAAILLTVYSMVVYLWSWRTAAVEPTP